MSYQNNDRFIVKLNLKPILHITIRHYMQVMFTFRNQQQVTDSSPTPDDISNLECSTEQILSDFNQNWTETNFKYY